MVNVSIWDENNAGASPERALWCNVFLTYLEDMNHYIHLKLKAQENLKKRYTLNYRGIDYASPLPKDKFIALLDMRMRRLILSAQQDHVKEVFDNLDMEHSSFVKRLQWQQETLTKIKLFYPEESGVEKLDKIKN